MTIDTPWHHVHIEYDEATGGYSTIEFRDKPEPARRRLPKARSPLGEAIALIEQSWPDDPTDRWGYGLLDKEKVLRLLRSVELEVLARE